MVQLTTRQEKLLTDIIENHLATSEPVGSMLLAKSKRWNVSPATLRNEMSMLEEEGLVTHQHTSSGRLPTEEGYRYYVSHFLSPRSLTDTTKKRLRDCGVLTDEHPDISSKKLAKELSRLSGAAVILGINRDYIYYTGLSNLVAEPEFGIAENLTALAESIDNAEPVIERLIDTMHDTVRVLIGNETLLTTLCSFVVSSFTRHRARGVIGVVGPMRMDYNKNYSLVSYAQELLSR